MKEYKQDRVLEVLALALDDNTPDHRLYYLLGKLRAYEISLDVENTALFNRMKEMMEGGDEDGM